PTGDAGQARRESVEHRDRARSRGRRRSSDGSGSDFLECRNVRTPRPGTVRRFPCKGDTAPSNVRISLFPVLPKILDADIGARAVREDRSEDAVRAVSDADERPKNVE